MLKINLARWKRWSRYFLPPDPLGGRQSGYARQYMVRDVIKVSLGGHLISHLKFSVQEAVAILRDLESWMDGSGFYDNNAIKKNSLCCGYRIYIQVSNQEDFNLMFCYMIRKTLSDTLESDGKTPRRCEVYAPFFINPEEDQKKDFFASPFIRILNISAFYKSIIEKMGL